jgi:hypothetical protein
MPTSRPTSATFQAYLTSGRCDHTLIDPQARASSLQHDHDSRYTQRSQTTAQSCVSRRVRRYILILIELKFHFEPRVTPPQVAEIVIEVDAATAIVKS